MSCKVSRYSKRMFSARFITFNKWVALAGAFLILLGVGSSLWHKFTASKPQPLHISQVHTITKKGAATLDITYPQIAEFQSTANHAANALLAARIRQVKESASSDMHITCQSIIAISSLWSVECLIATPSGATVMPFNYSLIRNKEVTLANLFNTKTSYLSYLSAAVGKELAAKEGKVSSLVKQATSPESNNFQKFVMTKDAVIFLFDPGTVSATSSGVQKVSLLYIQLRPYVSS